MKNPKLFRDLSVPFESAKASNEAVEAFFTEFGALREKHKLTNVYVIVSASYETEDKQDEAEFVTSCMFGDTMRAEMLTAWALGREQQTRQETIARFLESALKDARKRQG